MSSFELQAPENKEKSKAWLSRSSLISKSKKKINDRGKKLWLIFMPGSYTTYNTKFSLKAVQSQNKCNNLEHKLPHFNF